VAAFPAERAVLSHNAVVEGDVHRHFESAMVATREYHENILKQLNRGNSAEGIALEGAQFVSNLTDIQPFKVVYDLCKLMIDLSRENGEALSFSLSEDVPSALHETHAPKAEWGAKSTSDPETVKLTESQKNLNLSERLSLVALIDEGMRRGLSKAPVSADLFDNLWELVDATAKGGRINRLPFRKMGTDSQNGFQMFEIQAETGENLARLNMIYLKKRH